mgnify:CR=1 FL=1
MRRRAFRAAPRAAFVVTAIRLQSLTHLRACGAARFACLQGKALRAIPAARCLAPLQESRTGIAGSARPAPRPAAMGGARQTRHSLLRQVVRMCAALDAGGSCPSRHEGWFTDTPPGIAMQLPRHGSRPAPQGVAGAFLVVVGRLTWTASGHEPEKPSCGNAEPTMSPFGCGSSQSVLVLL